MGSAIFILAINAIVAVVLAGAFLVVARYDRSFASARWVSLAYGLGGAYFACEFLIDHWPASVSLALAGYGAFLLALAAYAVGMARKYEVHVPWRLMTLLLVASLLLNLYTQTLPRDLILRNVLWQLPYAAMQAVSGIIVMRSRRLAAADRLLAVVLAVSAVHFLLKPMLALEAGGPGATPGSYLDSAYALFSQASGTVLSLLVALMTLAVYVASMLTDANRKSETDTLSGLLNRRGFVDHAEETFRSGGPIALILADIDNFKSVNDTYGHEAGDRVIRAFSDVLREVAGDAHVVARIGGEEFAILLGATELSTARLIAEGARVTFAETQVQGLRPHERITASFGVAPWREGDGYDDLLRSADVALYEAKNAGRDCVRIAPPVLHPNGKRDSGDRRSVRDR
jgi:diguanylate cyclase (GGDEF)-like protein